MDPRDPTPGAEPAEEDVPVWLLPEATGGEGLVLKHGNLFLVTGDSGDISPAGARDRGCFLEDTRFLSFLEIDVAGGPPLVLSAESLSSTQNQIDMTVTDRAFGGVLTDPINFMHIRRQQVLEDELVERIVVTNFLTREVDYWVTLRFGADFADMFEVRGARRERRGTGLPTVVGPASLEFRYRGRDGRTYRTAIRSIGEPPSRVDGDSMHWSFRMRVNETRTLEVRTAPLIGDEARPPEIEATFDERLARAEEAGRRWVEGCTRFETGDEFVNAALDGGVADLQALSIHQHGRTVIAAGIPWFCAPFGRDSLIAGMQSLPVNPDLLRDSLAFLAAYQGDRHDPYRDEQPGKIFHELRRGEMALCGEVPHTPYYGSVDATPLFLVALSEYWTWTGDVATVEGLLPSARAAMRWMAQDGDLDDDGLVEYRRQSDRGLDNQGWKDSGDGVPYPDGTRAEPPIALVEVQGYALDAWRSMAMLLHRFGHHREAREALHRARRVRAALEDRFWMPEAGYYALALDGGKRQVPTVTSNPGHLLWSRAIPVERARQVARVLLSDRMFSGWGIRTLAAGQPAYNPLSYHNGTVWPHDNALIALGLSRYGLPGHEMVFGALSRVSRRFRRQRLPELFCGLPRFGGQAPVHYPVACIPQAWATGAPFMMLQAMLGLRPEAERGVLRVVDPQIPEWLHYVAIHGLRVGGSRVDLRFDHSPRGTAARVVDMRGAPLRVLVEVGGGLADKEVP
ncbi:amylo-alpha-1,6-glucosidase [Myxococcota bacterium]|nr:amylo-alpha-1,6-glucosidase [Myxococcota bacterium]